jgi:hypothetical protein
MEASSAKDTYVYLSKEDSGMIAAQVPTSPGGVGQVHKAV